MMPPKKYLQTFCMVALILLFSAQMTCSSNLEKKYSDLLIQQITDSDVFNVSPATVSQYFEKLIHISQNEKNAVEWIFTGIASDNRPLRHIIARFQPEEKKEGTKHKIKWLLLNIHLEIVPDKDLTFEKISHDITKKLNIKYTETAYAQLLRRAWQISETKGIIIEKNDGNHIVVDIAIFQGESEEY